MSYVTAELDSPKAGAQPRSLMQRLLPGIRRFCRSFGLINMVENCSTLQSDRMTTEAKEPKKLVLWMNAFHQHDDQEAFQRIFDYYREKLWKKLHLRRFYGYEPEDLFQEVNRDVARFLKNEIPHNLMGLVYRIADRKMVDFLRKQGGSKRVFVEVSLEEGERHLSSRAIGQEAWNHAHDLQRFLFSNLVNAKQREVLVLHFLLGHTLAEIHDQTGIPLNTVKSRLREGLRKLRQYHNKSEQL